MKYHKNKFYLKKKNCLISLLLMFILLSGVNVVNLENYYNENEDVEYSYYRISSNDTLWSIVDNYNFKEDKRDFIREVKKINNIDDNLQVGIIIAIPVN